MYVTNVRENKNEGCNWFIIDQAIYQTLEAIADLLAMEKI